MDLTDFDAALTYTSYYKYRDKCQNEKQRKHLESVIRHAKGEVEGDLSEVLPTLMPDPQYHEYGVYANATEDLGPKGMAAVTANYEEMVNNGSYVIESDKHRVVIADDEIVTEGSYRQILNQSVAKKMGLLAEDDNSHEFYVLFARTIVFWDFDENDLCSEDRYVTSHRLVPIDESDLPAHYPAHLRTTASA
jgi:hypothetical protein